LKKKFNNTLLKYGLIGVVNTIVGYGITFYLFYLGVLAELANLFGYIVGFFLSYFLNKKYNFKSINSHKKDLPKFLLSMGVAYVLNLIILMVCYRFFEMNVYLSQIIAGIVYTGCGYILSKRWVFRKNSILSIRT
jgi:putative flippase GtrA